MLGVEATHVLARALRLPSHGEREVGLHVGLLLSLIAVNVGPRFVMWPHGTEAGLEFSIKVPPILAGTEPRFIFGHGRLWRGEPPAELTFHCAPLRTPVSRSLSRALGRRLTGLTLRVQSRPVVPDAAPSSLGLLAVESALDGAHGEGHAAHELQRTAHAALLAVRAQLSVIAREEHGHAALAQDIVAWAEQRGGAEVRRAVGDAHAGLSLSSPRARSACGLARRWGVPPPRAAG
ncbi:MAG: hypothetical protein JWN48_3976 [Myxococcaceae bacterium]|nr:hypothetical protein [Myxococcaceae bacterium]